MPDIVLAPRSASPPYVIDAIDKALGRALTADDVFYDLGCGGDARIIIALAQAAAAQAGQAAVAGSTAFQQQQQASSSSSSSNTYHDGLHAHTTATNAAGPEATYAAADAARSAVVAAASHASTIAAAEGRGLLPEQQQQQQQLEQLGAHSATYEVPTGTTTVPSDAAAVQQHMYQEQQQQQQLEGSALQLPQFVGIELDEAAAARAIATVAQLQGDVQRTVKIVHGDLLQAPLHDATVVYTYLLPKGLSLLSQKLVDQLKPGSVVLTYMFKIPGWEHLLQATLPVTSGQPNRVDVSGVSKLYVYKVCVSKEG